MLKSQLGCRRVERDQVLPSRPGWQDTVKRSHFPCSQLLLTSTLYLMIFLIPTVHHSNGQYVLTCTIAFRLHTPVE